ncbi:glycosyl transferase family group 2-domain-containing protein [Butyriboletus roseoflavus]|nr:glycosyl transferase family group 2-domain-containing protein [Butyriboletus roseoflavus]
MRNLITYATSVVINIGIHPCAAKVPVSVHIYILTRIFAINVNRNSGRSPFRHPDIDATIIPLASHFPKPDYWPLASILAGLCIRALPALHPYLYHRAPEYVASHVPISLSPAPYHPDSNMAMDYDAYDALLHHIFKRTQGDAWFKPSEENISAGVCIRVEPGHFRVFPYENPYLAPFEAAIRTLNPVVAVKVRSAAVHAALSTVSDDADAIYVDHNTRIQILDSMAALPTAEKEQCGAVTSVCLSFGLTTWTALSRYAETLKKGSSNLSGAHGAPSPFLPLNCPLPAPHPTTTSLRSQRKHPHQLSMSSTRHLLTGAPRQRPISFWRLFSWRSTRAEHEKDMELAASTQRQTKLIAPFYNGLGCALAIFFIGSGVSMLLQESVLDGYWLRFTLLVTAPFTFCVSIFFCNQIISNLGMMFGPVSQYYENSKYYSAIKPEINKEVDANLPHITIEMPVYKESLEQTIAPSVFTLKKAMQTYARQGGSSAIFVHDDGLQLISEKDREARITFYADHNIGWVARPGHDSSPGGFKRAGRFKKASNMNYGLALSLKLEKHLRALQEAEEREELEDIDDSPLEDRALHMACDEVFAESGGKWKPWASNGRSLRIGEIILLVDADTVVPEDCLRDAARELAESPEVAIIQHDSDVMQVAHHYFENGITHFTRRINKCISLGCSNGEVAPFVGHNAFLRWSALQDAAFIDPADGKPKIWSESNVSEDFDMALRLQLKHYSIRWASYSQGGFKEGVSLTVDDELNRWQKYSYGCSELIFNPLIHWWRLGPINKQLRIFVWSDAPVHYKMSMMAYMFSYYGIAASAALSILNYFLLGFGIQTDGYYIHSFEVFLAILAVFPGSGNLGYIMLEYRLGHRSLIDSTIETATWILFFFFFFGGMSIHLTIALLAHMFSYNITWGATKKEVERSNFFIEVPRILKRFWFAFAVALACFASIFLFSLSSIVTADWLIPGSYWAVIFPLALVAGCHVLFPIVLNPWLMIFSY